jgi:hypothetical protein
VKWNSILKTKSCQSSFIPFSLDYIGLLLWYIHFADEDWKWHAASNVSKLLFFLCTLDGWMDGKMDGWMDGWTAQLNTCTTVVKRFAPTWNLSSLQRFDSKFELFPGVFFFYLLSFKLRVFKCLFTAFLALFQINSATRACFISFHFNIK